MQPSEPQTRTQAVAGRSASTAPGAVLASSGLRGALLISLLLIAALVTASFWGAARDHGPAADARIAVAAEEAETRSKAPARQRGGEGPDTPAGELRAAVDQFEEGLESKIEEPEEEPFAAACDAIAFAADHAPGTWARRRDGPLLVSACRPAAPPRAPPASQS